MGLSTFAGLEIGKSGLDAQQMALDVTSQNLTNASTPGYSRQVANLAANQPYSYPGMNTTDVPGQVGTGVSVVSVQRIRDQFIDQQVQTEDTTQGYWQSRQDMLSQMEQVVGEPSGTNIRTYSDSFFSALQTLTTNPSDSATRQNVVQTADSLCDEIQQSYTEYQEMESNANQQVQAQVNQINSITEKIASLNDQIGKVTPLGENANDLEDQREVLVEQLAGFTNFTSNTDPEGRLNIAIAGMPLVSGSDNINIATVPDSNGNFNLYWMDSKNANVTSSPVTIQSGSLQGLIEIRDQDLPNMINQLNTFSSTLITQFNAIHEQGYGIDNPPSHNVPFFTGTDAENIAVSSDVANDLNKVAASSVGVDENGDGAVGDNVIATQLANLQQAQLFNNGTTTMGDYLGQMVDQLGTNAQNANTQYTSEGLLITNLDNSREQVCGVSYDEEMTNMIEQQQGYNAAAKIVSTMDAMLDVIVNQLKVNP